jgi:hypothetical protein
VPFRYFLANRQTHTRPGDRIHFASETPHAVTSERCASPNYGRIPNHTADAPFFPHPSFKPTLLPICVAISSIRLYSVFRENGVTKG